MAWNGAAAGTAQYQLPYANGEAGYQQQQIYPPPQQYGQQPPYGAQYSGQPPYAQSGPTHHGSPDNQTRPPKKKGNPIITRYPPPPGYRGPAQPQAPYGHQQYTNQYKPPPQQGYQSAYPGPPNYQQQNQAYAGAPNYPSNQAYSQGNGAPHGTHQGPYPPPQHYQNGYPQSAPPYPQQGYPNQPYPQPPNYQANQSYPPPQGSYQGYGTHPGALAGPTAPVPYSSGAQGWQPSNSQPPHPPSSQYTQYGAPSINGSDPNATPVPASARLSATQNTSTQTDPGSALSEHGKKLDLYLGWDDWDFDFDGAIWPKSNEPIDPNLSLGVIVWHPAKQVTRALPSTFHEAEEQALKPPAEKLGNGESVSIYFTPENSHEAFLDIRQTDIWSKIKDDTIFVVFPDDSNMDLIPIEECIAQRDRPDLPLEEDVQEAGDEEMQDSSWNVMDNLEQALSGQDEDPGLAVSRTPTRTPNQNQEDILASLGVTGSPKPVSKEPLPFPYTPSEEGHSAPEKPPISVPMEQSLQQSSQPRSNSYGGHQISNPGPPLNQRSYGSMSATTPSRPPPPPPPPPPERKESFDWQNRSNGYATYDGSRESPARSEASHNTLAGSDFESENPPAPPKDSDTILSPEPLLSRSESSISRKRSYDEADDEKLRQQDDHTPRNKRRQPQVAAAYSRR